MIYSKNLENAAEIVKIQQKSVIHSKNREIAAKVGRMQQRSGKCSKIWENDIEKKPNHIIVQTVHKPINQESSRVSSQSTQVSTMMARMLTIIYYFFKLVNQYI